MLNGRRVWGWALFWVLAMGLVLATFFLFGAAMDEWVMSRLAACRLRPLMTGLLVVGLLGSDILLPVPSSVVSTAGGYALGFVGGTLVSFVGLSISSLMGYWLGRLAAPAVLGRLLGVRESEAVRGVRSRWGDWVVVISRPVPVLAEASTLFAGASGMAFGRFVLMCSLANLGISGVYAAVGSLSADVDSFLAAFVAALVLPGIAMLVGRRVSR